MLLLLLLLLCFPAPHHARIRCVVTKLLYRGVPCPSPSKVCQEFVSRVCFAHLSSCPSSRALCLAWLDAVRPTFTKSCTVPHEVAIWIWPFRHIHQMVVFFACK